MRSRRTTTFYAAGGDWTSAVTNRVGDHVDGTFSGTLVRTGSSTSGPASLIVSGTFAFDIRR